MDGGGLGTNSNLFYDCRARRAAIDVLWVAISQPLLCEFANLFSGLEYLSEHV